MDNTVTNFAKTSQALADQAADKAQSAIHSAQPSVQTVGDILSNKRKNHHVKEYSVCNELNQLLTFLILGSRLRVNSPIQELRIILPQVCAN